jgi:predicted nucleic acid-binding protein
MQLSWPDTHAFLNMLRDLLTVHPLTVEVQETGLELAERYGFSTYDAMIAASALHAGCDTLWSKDMQHARRLWRQSNRMDWRSLGAAKSRKLRVLSGNIPCAA